MIAMTTLHRNTIIVISIVSLRFILHVVCIYIYIHVMYRCSYNTDNVSIFYNIHKMHLCIPHMPYPIACSIRLEREREEEEEEREEEEEEREGEGEIFLCVIHYQSILL